MAPLLFYLWISFRLAFPGLRGIPGQRKRQPPGGYAARADKNIQELLGDLRGTFLRLRQGGIDEELFDVISGFEALSV